MEQYFALPESERRTLLEQTSERKNLPVQSIEKDLWVCWLLHQLMTLEPWGQHLTFKGGTSLSKAHGLIDRFSEDIDLVVDRVALELVGGNDPALAGSPRQAKERAKRIAKSAYAWTVEELLPTLHARLSVALPNEGWELELLPITEHQETSMQFRYPKLFEGGTGYLRPEIKVELVAKADPWPSRPMPISSYVHQHFPEMTGDGIVHVNTMQAERTMLEKALLLHETLITRPDGPRPRLSRHYYDLFKLHRAGFGDKVMSDPELYPAIVAHRRTFYRYPSVDYDALLISGFSIVPKGDTRTEWEKDYTSMQRDMFHGEVPSFSDVLTTLHEFETTFRTHLRTTLTSIPREVRH
jgi:hypothetical protein